MGAQTAAIYASDVIPSDKDAADAVICDSPVPGMEFVLKEMFGDGNTEPAGIKTQKPVNMQFTGFLRLNNKAADGNRTRDLRTTNATHYRLCYSSL